MTGHWSRDDIKIFVMDRGREREARKRSNTCFSAAKWRLLLTERCYCCLKRRKVASSLKYLKNVKDIMI